MKQNISSHEELIKLLAEHSIDYKQWIWKTSDHLLEEINNEESYLKEDVQGRLVRCVRAIGIDIFHKSNNGLFKLMETKQIYNNGQIRKRQLQSSIAEKQRTIETAEQCAYRALREELGINQQLNLLPLGPTLLIQPSTSYPGLLTEHYWHRYRCLLPVECYSSSYIEKQQAKTIVFEWQHWT